MLAMRARPLVSTAVALAAGWIVIDGDTIHAPGERYRLLDIDAPEIHRAQCDAERRLGELAKRRLQALLDAGPVAFSPDPPTKRDRYGRLLAHLIVNGEDVACVLIREGYAVPWSGRRANWCGKEALGTFTEVAHADCATTSSTD
jgi:endonuclease YncB( thermonuclease family)